MAVRPGTYNVVLQRRADYDVQLSFTDSNGAAIDLTDWTVTAQAWDKARTTKSADFQITYTNRVGGVVNIGLTDAQTATFPAELYYDVLLENPSGLKEYYLEGIIYVSEGYTA
jgi:FlaG/FlaF family flagellin (archaellin)